MKILITVCSLFISINSFAISEESLQNLVTSINPSLSSKQVDQIAAAISFYSYKEGVDERLVVAVIMTESSFNVTARGSKGEIGLMQLRPEFHSPKQPNKLFDPVYNISRGVKYLSTLNKKYGESYPKFNWIELYNRGPNSRPKTFKYTTKVKKYYIAFGGPN